MELRIDKINTYIKSALNLKHKGVSMMEMMLVMTLVSLFLVATMPFVTSRLKGMGKYDISTTTCIRTELAANLNSDACSKAVNYCAYDTNNACNTINYFVDTGSAAEQNAARKVFKAVCDQGGAKGCRFFVTSCRNDNTTCSNTTSDYDLFYYLNLPANSTNAGKFSIIDYGQDYYNAGLDNIVYWVTDQCQTCSEGNVACLVKGCPGSSLFWQYQINGNDNGDDFGQDITVDNQGNVYATGSIFIDSEPDVFIIKMNSTGNMTSPYGFHKILAGLGSSYDLGRAIAVDNSGNIYVAGRTTAYGDKDIFITKMNSTGNITSPYGYNKIIGSALDEDVHGITVDNNGNAYIVGNSSDSGGSYYHLLLAKVNASGNMTSPYGFSKRLTAGSEKWHFGAGIKYIDDNSIYVTSSISKSNVDCLGVIKMNALGSMTCSDCWQRRIVSTGSRESFSMVPAIDSNKDVYVAGFAQNGANYDIALLKLNASGNITYPYGWQKKITLSTDLGYDYSLDIAIGTDNNPYVMGQYYNGSSNNLFLLKMNSLGNMTYPYGWQKTLRGTQLPSNLDDINGGLAIDTNGYYYIINSAYNGANYDILMMKVYNSFTGGSLFTSETNPFTTMDTGNILSNVTNPYDIIEFASVLLLDLDLEGNDVFANRINPGYVWY